MSDNSHYKQLYAGVATMSVEEHKLFTEDPDQFNFCYIPMHFSCANGFLDDSTADWESAMEIASGYVRRFNDAGAFKPGYIPTLRDWLYIDHILNKHGIRWDHNGVHSM